MPYEFPQDTADLLVLGLEFDTDPAGVGYPAGGVENTANDPIFDSLINTVSPTILVKRQTVATSAIFNAVVPSERQGLSPQQSDWFRDMLTLGQISPATQSGIVAELVEVLFGPQADSHASLMTLFTEPGSRLKQMQQDGLLSKVNSFTVSTPGQIRAART